MILQKNRFFFVCVCLCVCECVCTRVFEVWSPLDSYQGKLEKTARDFETEKKGVGGEEPSLQLFVTDISRVCCFRVQKRMNLSWSGKCPSYKYLQFIMLQLLVFPFPFPPAKWFLKNITVFKNYFFNVEKIWKSYWTASGNTASPSSQWADGWTIHKVKEEVGGGSKSPVLCGPLLYLLRAGPSQNPEPGFLLGSRPLPSTERNVGCWERQSRDCKVLEAEGEGDRGSPSRHC